MIQTATLIHHDNAKAHTDTCTGVENKKLCMWLFLASDCMFFGTLISTHLIYRRLYPQVIDKNGEVLNILTTFNIELTSFSSFVLLMSSFLMALAVSAIHKGQLRSFRRTISGVIVFGLIFLGCQVYEFMHFVELGMTLKSSIFGSTFYLMTGTHGAHVAGGVLWLLLLLLYSFTGKLTAQHALDIEIAGLYWHFVDIVWIVIFTAVYLLEYL